MKIIKFNESQSNGKFVKITFHGENTVSLEDVEHTDAYQNIMDDKNDYYGNYKDRRNAAIWYGAEQI